MNSIEDDELRPKSKEEYLREAAIHLAQEEKKIAALLSQMPATAISITPNGFMRVDDLSWVNTSSYRSVTVINSSISGVGGDGNVSFADFSGDPGFNVTKEKVNVDTPYLLSISGHSDLETMEEFRKLAPLKRHPTFGTVAESGYYFSEDGNFAKTVMMPPWLDVLPERVNLYDGRLSVPRVYSSPMSISEFEIAGEALNRIKEKLTTYLTPPAAPTQ